MNGYFMRADRCTACDASGLSPTAKAMIVVALAMAASLALLFFVLRRNGAMVKRRLLLEREDLAERRNALARRLSSAGVQQAGVQAADGNKRARGVRRKKSVRRSLASMGLSKAHLRGHFQLLVVLKVRALTVHAAQGMVKAAEGGDVVGETARILIGFGQVMHHLVRKTMSSSVLVFIELR